MNVLTATQETPIVPVTVVDAPARTSLGTFLLHAVLASLIAALAILGALVTHDHLTKAKPATITLTPATTGVSASVGDVVNYKWTEIVGPNGVKLYTQCSTTEAHTRVFLSSTGHMDWRPDSNCK